MIYFWERFNALLRSKYWSFILATVFLLILLLLVFPSVRSTGYTVFGDIDVAFYFSHYLTRMQSPWNSHWSNPNFFNLTRLPFVSILWSVCLFFGGDAFVFQSLLFVTILLGSGIGMWFCVWRISLFDDVFRKHSLGYGVLWCVALTAGVLYMLSPWALIRIQHVYLLLGYSVMPWVFVLLWYIYTQKQSLVTSDSSWFDRCLRFYSFPLLFLLSLLWVIGAGAVHYLFYIGILVAGYTLYQVVRFGYKGDFLSQPRLCSQFVILLVLTIGFLSYFFFPYITASLIGGTAPNNVNTADAIALFSRNSSLLDVLYQTSYWWRLFDETLFAPAYWLGGAFILFISLGVSLLRLRHSIVRFFLVWVCIFALLAMGTNGPLKYMTLWLIFASPFSGICGFLFRDPNKLVGLMGFGISILWGLNLASVASYLLSLKHRIALEYEALHIVDPSHYLPARRRWNIYSGFLLLLPLAAVLSLVAYVFPVTQLYLFDYYSPVTPDEDQLRYNIWHDVTSPEDRVMYLPRTERIVSPGKAFAVTHWNQNTDNDRPTSGTDIFGSAAPTYNPTEGSTPMMGYLYDFISYSFQEGLSDGLLHFLSSIGVDQVVYHADVVGMREVHDASILTLFSQEGIREKLRFGLWYVARLYGEDSGVFEHAIWSAGGYSTLHTLSEMPGFSFLDTALYFLGTAPDMLSHVSRGDILHWRFWPDILLSDIPDEYIIRPFHSTLYADSFTRWARNRVTTLDWQWHLEHMKLDTSWTWQHDMDDGIVMTYGPRMVDLEPYEDPFTVGELVFETADFADAELDFFVPEDPDHLSVEFAPRSTLSDEPFLKGDVPASSSDYWKVATSRDISVKALNGYAFSLTLSGRYTHQLHGKVKYYDVNGEELTVSYISAPRQVASFDEVHFTGQFITPEDCSFVRIQLWTLERPEIKLYWWVHDMRIYDLESRTRENTLKVHHNIPADDIYSVYVRTFLNPYGGELSIALEGHDPVIVSTDTTDVSQFAWQEVGQFTLERGRIDITLENITGLNAVQKLVIAPESYMKDHTNRRLELLDDTATLYALEAEQDMVWSGNIQSDASDITLSVGKGLYLSEGLVAGTVDIAEPNLYTIFIRGGSVIPGDIQASVSQGASLIDPLPYAGSVLPSVDYDRLGTYVFTSGSAGLQFSLQDSTPSLFTTEGLHPFAYGEEWSEREHYLDTLGDDERNLDCCECVDLGPDPLVIETLYDSVKASVFSEMDITQGCSCWWVISASEIAPVLENDEYLLSFDVQASFARRNHFKVIFLDTDKVYLDHAILEDTSIDMTYPWETVERLISVPLGSRYAQFQVWSRQNKFTPSRMEVRELSFRHFRSLPLLDSVVIAEGEWGNLEEFFTTLESQNSVVHRLISDSYSALWLADDQLVLPLGGVVQSQIISSDTVDIPPKRSFIPHKYYQLGLLVSGFVFILSLCFVLRSYFIRDSFFS